MTGDIHPLAPHSLPPFVGAADGSDPLFSAIIFIVILAVLGVGVFYLKLHAIPEQLAHKHGNTQSQLIMVLALLALFTHNNICLLYTSPSPRDVEESSMPSSA